MDEGLAVDMVTLFLDFCSFRIIFVMMWFDVPAIRDE